MQDAKSRLSARRKERRWSIFLGFLGILIIVSLLFFRVWFSSKGVELACEIDLLSAEKEALEDENRKLSLETAKLKSPERISRIAVMELNMVRPPEAEVVTLELTP